MNEVGKDESIEMDLLLEGVYKKFGLDFRGYARDSLGRRVANFMDQWKLQNISQVQERLFHQEEATDFII